MSLITGQKISQLAETVTMTGSRKFLLSDIGVNETITYDNLVSELSSVFGNVYKVGTPANNQLGVWTGDGTIEGDSNLTWDGTILSATQFEGDSFNGALLTSTGSATDFLNANGSYSPIVAVTQDEKDALGGTDGTPSLSNKYVTDSDSRMSDSRTPSGSAGGDLTGNYPNPDISNDAVTYAKIQNVTATNIFLGRDSAGAGIIEEINAASARGILNVENGATADQTGSEIESLLDVELGNTEWKDPNQTGAEIEALLDVELGNTEWKDPNQTGSQIEALLDVELSNTDWKKAVGTSSSTVAAGNDSRFPTSSQKSALIGTGAPSGSNLYVTEDTLNNNSVVNDGNTASYSQIKTVIVEIGNWDMSVNGNYDFAHGLSINLEDVRDIRVTIINDAGTKLHPLDSIDSSSPGTVQAGNVNYITDTRLYMHRIQSALFDNSDFNAVGNRGWATITYEN